VSPENVLVLHHTHRLIIDVQPSFTTIITTASRATVTVRVEHIERVVSAACGRAVVVEHTIEHVAGGLSGSSRSRCHDIYTRYSQLRLREEKRQTRTEWDFEIWGELNRFSNLDCATRSRVVKEALEMKDQHGWERLD